MGSNPFLRLTIAFIVGIILQEFLPTPPEFLLLSLLTAALLAFCFSFFIIKSYSLRWIGGVAVFSIFLLLGFSIAHWSGVESNPSILQEHTIHQVKEGPKETEKSYQYVTEVYSKSNQHRITGACLLYLKKSDSTKLSVNDWIGVKRNIQSVSEPKNPFEFDYKSYLERKGILYQVFLDPNDYKVLQAFPGNSFQISTLRKYLENKLEYFLPSAEEHAVAKAMILGGKSDLSDDLSEIYAGTGAMHVLAVSGLHVGIIYLIFSQLLWFLSNKKNGKWIKTFLLLVVIWTFAFLTGLSPSVSRAATMFSFFALGSLKGGKGSIYNALAASAFLLLCIQPALIFHVGFQLSYLAVLSIVAFQPLIYNAFYVKNFVLDKIWQLSAVSIAAQLGTFPLAIYYFHQFPGYFLLSNLIVIPGATIILCLGILLLVFAPIGAIAKGIAFLLSHVISATNALLAALYDLPFSKFQNLVLLRYEVAILLALLLLTYLFWSSRKWLYLNFILALFCIWQIASIFQLQSKQNELVIHHVQGNTAISANWNECTYFFADDAIDSSKLGFHVTPYWLHKGNPVQWIREMSPTEHIYFYKKALLLSHTKLFVLDTNQISNSKSLKVDILLVKNSPKIDLERLLSAIDFEVMVLDASNNYYFAREMERELKKRNIKVHNTYHSGAYISQIL